MDKKECVILLGEIIVILDTQCGSMLLDDPRRIKLDKIRDQLYNKQIQLAKMAFNESTMAYQVATVQLKAITKTIKESIDDVNQTAETFAALASFISAVDGLIGLAIDLA
ncbi:MAG: hypothetical protein HGB23_11275 [Chlorobiaceae bacterium]|nr:hypothetical protein [Chlorobiaceae bacterium]